MGAEGEEPDRVVSANIHGTKRMLIMSMDYNGIPFYKLRPERTTVSSAVYKEFLEKNLDNWLGARSSKFMWLLHDNARPHKAAIITEYLKIKELPFGTTRHIHPILAPLILIVSGN